MRDSDHERPPDPPVRAVRRTPWEWRTFGDDLADLDALAPLRTEASAESDETYVLSMHSDASVKVRDGVLDTRCSRR